MEKAKLYIYDHCPYCVKARMIFGYKNHDVNLIYLLNDDEDTPKKLIGQKMVPILVLPEKEPQPESLDIIKTIDQISEPMVASYKEDPKLSQWVQDSRNYVYLLAMPRWIQMPLEDFKTQKALDYFTTKKENYIGSFTEHWKNSSKLIQQAESHLQELEALLVSASPYYLGDQLSVSDFHLYATLRSLSCVKGLNFPPRTLTYMKKQEEFSQVPLHFDWAL